MANWNKYFWYGMVFIISIITLFAVPMVGSAAGLAWDIPNTVVGWVVWTVGNLCSSVLNVLLFHSFTKQGKVNVLEDPKYLEAESLLIDNKIESEEIPLSPEVLIAKTYKKKLVMIFVFTLLGTIGLSQAVLQFDGARFLAQVITVSIGLIAGVMQMKHVEEVWTIRYLKYAKWKVKEKAEEELKSKTTDYNEVHERTVIERVIKEPVKNLTKE